MKILIFSFGDTSLASYCYLHEKGQSPRLFTRDKKKAELWHNKLLPVEGKITAELKLDIYTDLSLALDGVDLVLITTPSWAHLEIFSQLEEAGYEGDVLVYNGNWASLSYRLSGAYGETSSQPFIANFDGERLHIATIKEQVDLATLGAFPLEKLQGILPKMILRDSLLEVSLRSTNPLIHVPLALSQLAFIEEGKEFLFYKEGATKSNTKLVLALDRERLRLGQQLGYTLPSVLELINSFFTDKKETLLEALKENPVYAKVKAPKSLDHRYFTEDIPYGLAPLVRIGELIGVDMVMTRRVLEAASLYGLPSQGVHFTMEDLQKLK